MKGMPVWVYKGMFKGNGISHKYEQMHLVGEGIPEILDVEPERTLVLIKRNLFSGEYLHCEPLIKQEKGIYCAGENFIYSSDSRFPNKYPIKIHDRVEE